MIEDNPESADLIRRIFDEQNACSAFVCRNISEAKAYLLGAGMYSDRKEFPFPNATICDLRFGEETATDFLKWIRNAAEDFKTLPVFVLANRDSPAELTTAEQLGATQILRKPAAKEGFHDMFVDLASKLCA